MEEENYKAKYAIADYKKGCRTCKTMNMSITPKRFKFEQNGEQSLPTTDINKLRSKAEPITHINPRKIKVPQSLEELKNLDLESLLKLIEMLEKENASLKK